jgi:hypothetical protein
MRILTEVSHPLLLPMLSQQKEKSTERFVDNEETKKDHQICVIVTNKTNKIREKFILLFLLATP